MIAIQKQPVLTDVITISKDKTILIVEDNNIRIEWFEKRLEGMKFVVCVTPQMALTVLKNHDFDIVFLDHDAVPVFIPDDHPDHKLLTFFRVAQLLKRIDYKGVVVIHSQNPVGAKRMQRELEDQEVYVLPFGHFELKVE